MIKKSAVILVIIMLMITRGGFPDHTTGKAEKIFINGHIVTMDENNPEVEAMAVGNGKILLTGTTTEIKKNYPDTEVVNLKGKTVMPGIIESHGHLLSLGQSFLQLNLEGIETPEKAVEMVRKRVEKTPPGEWIVGWGWDDGAWAKNYPNNKTLSKVSPDNPVYLRGLHGFASWANEKALKIAGIGADSPNPPKGEILKDKKTNKPTGILTNKAQDLLSKYIPPMSLLQIEKALQLALHQCAANGLTTVHEANTSSKMLKALRSMKKKKNSTFVSMSCWTAPIKTWLNLSLKKVLKSTITICLSPGV